MLLDWQCANRQLIDKNGAGSGEGVGGVTHTHAHLINWLIEVPLGYGALYDCNKRLTYIIKSGPEIITSGYEEEAGYEWSSTKRRSRDEEAEEATKFHLMILL